MANTARPPLFERLTQVAVEQLKPERIQILRGYYRKSRQKLAPIMRLMYGSFTAAELRQHLERRIGTNYKVLMVHSSVNHMHPMFTDSAKDLLKMLLDFCAPDRTLVMPAFCFDQRSPRFDVLRTPSQMGLLTELFRRTKGVSVSRHPVYRIVAFGPLARELAAGHETAPTFCGPGTPFDFMARHESLILGIGKTFEVLTQVHHAEDVMGEAFPVPARRNLPCEVALVEGDTVIRFAYEGRAFEWKRNMWRLRLIMNREMLHEWSFHHVPLFATRASDVSAAIMEAARRGVTIYEKP